ncbi:MAG: hypothetical protein K6C05_08240 [Anaerovibrio sp.]|uniref:hypothetical protein n=1 Tax=Anaerovibrio sp. TaxID=1872532 RepID=UPI0025E84DF5|nr:hypothetical protein [Anaerovibrio sp.]MCR5176825.1 hypothetical protein [Anaerovibrio sp.]
MVHLNYRTVDVKMQPKLAEYILGKNCTGYDEKTDMLEDGSERLSMIIEAKYVNIFKTPNELVTEISEYECIIGRKGSEKIDILKKEILVGEEIEQEYMFEDAAQNIASEDSKKSKLTLEKKRQAIDKMGQALDMVMRRYVDEIKKGVKE